MKLKSIMLLFTFLCKTYSVSTEDLLVIALVFFLLYYKGFQFSTEELLVIDFFSFSLLLSLSVLTEELTVIALIPLLIILSATFSQKLFSQFQWNFQISRLVIFFHKICASDFLTKKKWTDIVDFYIDCQLSYIEF